MSKDEEYQGVEIIDVPEESTAVVKKESAAVDRFDFTQAGSVELATAYYENRGKLMDNIKKMAIEITKDHWIDQGGQPYLEGKGANLLISRFAVSFETKAPKLREMVDDIGKYQMWLVPVVARVFDTVAEAIGACSQRNQFFSTFKDRNTGQKKRRKDSEISSTNLLQTAITAGKRKAVVTVFGLDGLTWDDLAKFGISPKATVNYKGQKKKSMNNNCQREEAQAQEQKKAVPPSNKAVEEFKQTIIDWLGDETAADNWLYDAGKELPYSLEINGFDMIKRRDKALLADLIKHYEEKVGGEYYGSTGDQ